MLSEPNLSYKPFWGICRPLNSWRANSPNPIQIYCAIIIRNDLLILGNMLVDDYILDILLELFHHSECVHSLNKSIQLKSIF